MKLNIGKKIVLFLHWLFALIMSAIAVLYYVAPATVNQANEWLVQRLGRNETTVLLVIILVVYLLLVAATAAVIFRNKEKREERGYIVIDNGDKGRSRIALSAIDSMVRQSVRNIDGVSELKTAVIGQQDAVTINAIVTAQNGAHIPTITANVQNSIRNYIELNCGVTVREVCVSVNALDVTQDAPSNIQAKATPKVMPDPEPVPVRKEEIDISVPELKPEAVEQPKQTEVEDDEYYIPGEGEDIELKLDGEEIDA